VGTDAYVPVLLDRCGSGHVRQSLCMREESSFLVRSPSIQSIRFV
jgi:hypothetical protein